MMTYNEFQQACKQAWKTEGQGSENVRQAHDCLLRVDKTVEMTLGQLMAQAWKLYKSNYSNQ